MTGEFLIRGERFTRVEDTYDSGTCGICGRRRKCDWYISRKAGWSDIYLDMCRGCAKTVEVKE